MIRFLLLLALAYGVFWCYNNIDFGSATNSFSNGVKNGKIVKSVNDGRQKVVDDSESVADNY